MTKQQIKCPNCDTAIDVNDLLYHQLEERVKSEYSGKLATLEKDKQKLSEAIETGVKRQMQTEKIRLEKKLRTEIGGENSEAIQALEEQLKHKSGEVKDLNKAYKKDHSNKQLTTGDYYQTARYVLEAKPKKSKT